MNLQEDRITDMCTSLQLDWVAAEYAGLAQTAANQSASYTDFLEHLLKCELDGRHERAKQTMLKMAVRPLLIADSI